MEHIIPTDESLLNTMVSESESVPELYRPGKYWLSMTKAAANEIRKYGLSDFRGASNSIGTSYADNAYIDTRNALNFGPRRLLYLFLKKTYPFSMIYDSQVSLTRGYYSSMVEFKNQIASQSPLIANLIGRFKVPNDTVRGGCQDYSDIPGLGRVSNHYLELLHTHEVLQRHIDFGSANSFFEIGGGFGVNVHILIENYRNIRKFVYLDIPPNLYVGTQYLRSFYGDSIKSYLETKHLDRIRFDATDNLEILCIAPHQIERLDVSIDIFQNAHSFVEMPQPIVANYAKHVERLMNPKKSSIALVSYDGFDPATTPHPDNLQNNFKRNFNALQESTLWKPKKKNFYYIGNL